MQRRVNLRLLAWTVCVLGGLTLGANLLHGVQTRRNAHYLFERGAEALASSEIDQGLLYLSQYLKLNPRDLDARETFDLALDKLAHDPPAKIRVVLRLEDLLTRDPDRDNARLRLIHNLIDLYRYKDAVIHLKILIPHRQNDPDLQRLLGWCQSAAGNLLDAVATLRKAIAADPRGIATYRLLAEIYHDRLAQDDDAAKVMDGMVEANPTNHEAYLVRSRFARAHGKLAEAVKDLEKAVEIAPDEATVLLALAAWSEEQGRRDDARRYLRRGVELHPENGNLVRGLSDVELRSEKRGEAVTVLRSGLAKNPQNVELEIRLTDLLIDAQETAEAATHIQSLQRSGPVPALTNYLRARLAIASNKLSDAIPLLERTRAELPATNEWASRVYAVLGECYRQTGDLERGLAASQQAVRLEPGWTLAKERLGEALLAAGRLEEALIQLEAVGKAKDPPPAVWTALARAQLLANLRRSESQRDWRGFEDSMAKASAAEPASQVVTLLRAGMWAALHKLDDARTLIERARAADNQPVFWAALADLDAQEGHVPQAFERLDQATSQLGDKLELRLARVNLCGLRGNEADRARLKASAEALDAYPPEARVKLLRVLASAWRDLNDLDQAAAVWREVALLAPRDIESRLALFEAALATGDRDRCKTLLAELRRLEGDEGNRWRWAQAALVVADAKTSPAKLAEARAMAAELARRQRDWPRVALLEAKLDELEGKWERAIENGLRAVDLGERNRALVRRLAALLMERRQYAQAEHLLLVVEGPVPLPPDLMRTAVDAAAATKNARRVRQLTPPLFPTPPRDYRDLLWLAQVDAAIGDNTKAEGWLRKAVQVGEHDPETWIALVRHLARTGQHAAVESVIAQMETKLRAERRPLTRARCWAGAGEPIRASEAFASALALQPTDFLTLAAAAEFHVRNDEPDLAMTYFERLLDSRAAAPPDVRAAARRELAILRAVAGAHGQALALLDVNAATLGAQAADARVRLFVDGQDPMRRKKAVQQLKESLSRYPSTSDEELLLVRLLVASGDGNRARDQLGMLLATQERPDWIARYVRLLVETDSASEAMIWFTRLERWEPAAPRTLALRQLILQAKTKT